MHAVALSLVIFPTTASIIIADYIQILWKTKKKTLEQSVGMSGNHADRHLYAYV